MIELMLREPVASYISSKAVKGERSEIAGRGLIAVAPIAKGQVVAVKGGHIVDSATMHALSDKLQNSEIQIAEGLHLVALSDDEYEPVMLFLNHSCDPNVGFAGNVVVVAMRDVQVGEELTTDYAMFDSSDDKMECHCGSERCRNVVRGADWQRPDLQARYQGYFSWYLAQRMG